MATTYRNTGSKFWFARFNDRTGKRISRSTKTESRREAKRIAEDMEAKERKAGRLNTDVPLMILRTVEIAALEMQQGTLTTGRAEELIRTMLRTANPDAVDGSFKRFSAAWLDMKEKDTVPETSKSYRDAVKYALRSLGSKAEASLHKITVGDMEKLQADLVAAGLRAKTVNDHMSLIRRILESAVQKDLIAKNPARPIKGRSKADSKKRAPFTLPEVRKLIQAAPDTEWKGLVTLGAHTGLRCGDLLRLNSENIVGTTIKLQPSKTSASTGAVLTIPLSPPCLAWMEGRKGELFPTIKLMKATTVCGAFSRIMKDAGISKTVVLVAGDNPVTATKSFHSLRHSFASFLAEADVHADVRQKLTGHTSGKVHAIYTHHDESLARAVATLPAL